MIESGKSGKSGKSGEFEVKISNRKYCVDSERRT